MILEKWRTRGGSTVEITEIKANEQYAKRGTIIYPNGNSDRESWTLDNKVCSPFIDNDDLVERLDKQLSPVQKSHARLKQFIFPINDVFGATKVEANPIELNNASFAMGEQHDD